MKITIANKPDKTEPDASPQACCRVDASHCEQQLSADLENHIDTYNEMWGKKSCFPISTVIVLILLVVLLPFLDASDKSTSRFTDDLCTSEKCRFQIVESIPEGLVYKNSSIKSLSTFEVWRYLIAQANESIKIGSFYWTLLDKDLLGTYPGSDEGETVFNDLIEAGAERGIKIKIAQSQPSKKSPNIDTQILAEKAGAEVRDLDMPKLVGGGVLHTKLWVIDDTIAYVGSANMDWRSLTQVKELGVLIDQCPCVVKDVEKLFEVYWEVGESGKVPDSWPESLSTAFNIQSPLQTLVNGAPADVYLTSSPPQFCTKGRSNDIDGILRTINSAKTFIGISVMDYIPLMIYTPKPEFWPIIDDALKAAAIDRKVKVKLLISWWNHSRPAIDNFMRSLIELNNVYKGVDIQVKRFIVPASAEQKKIPYARVNHNKYMVTDNTAYIGTSNWSGDYFVNTAGVGVVTTGNTTLRSSLEEIFFRDWNSEYALPQQ